MDYPAITDRRSYPSAKHVEAHLLDAHGISYISRPSLAQTIAEHVKDHETPGRTHRVAHTHKTEND